jgi:HK97 gp10 family phage protein
MITYKIKLENADQVRAAFARYPKQMTKEAGDAVGRSVLTIERNAKREAPVAPYQGGTLRQSIRGSKTGPLSGKVEVGVHYGGYVELGTKPHTIRSHGAYPLRNVRTGQVFGRVVRHPGTSPNPFLKRGVESSERDVNNFFISAVKRALEL